MLREQQPNPGKPYSGDLGRVEVLISLALDFAPTFRIQVTLLRDRYLTGPGFRLGTKVEFPLLCPTGATNL